MTVHVKTTIRAVGPDVADLVEGGIVILFADGAPPELAEVAVLHAVEHGPSTAPPPVGARVVVGDVEATLTAVGSLAWAKMIDMGHVVINFDGASTSLRPGELNASPVAAERLAGAIAPGASIAITS